MGFLSYLRKVFAGEFTEIEDGRDELSESDLRSPKKPDVIVRKIGPPESYPTIDDFNREYLLMREEQEQWLDQMYDTKSVLGVERIPLDAVSAPGSGSGSSTGTIDMHLRRKGFLYSEAGNEALALACMKRSNEIRFFKRAGYRRDDYYSYVRMLIRFGHVSQARIEKERIDSFFGNYVDDSHVTTWDYALQFLSGEALEKRKEELRQMFQQWDNLINFEIERTNKRREYCFVSSHFPDLCPKSQGAYTRAKKENSKRYQQIICAMKQQNLSFPEPLK